MRATFLFLAFLFASIGSAKSAEFCYDKYEPKLAAVDAALAANLKELSGLEARLVQVRAEKDVNSKAMSDILRDDPALQKPGSRERLVELAQNFDKLEREEVAAKSRSFDLQDKIASYRTVIPAALSGELRGCVDATKEATKTVNLVIQTLAILTTGGTSLALPQKALYVDMAAVLNEYPFGGDASVINAGREAVFNSLGMGENNDIRKTIEDPGRVIRCIWGC